MISYLKQAREYVTPVRSSSAFLSRGVLTPEEFLEAGDELVFKCPTWSWEAGEPSRARSHLPKDKQYLIIRNVPCAIRAATMENSVLGETEVEMASPDESNRSLLSHDEGWMMSHINEILVESEENGAIDDDFDLVDADGEVIPKPQPIPPPSCEEEEEEYADMDNFEDTDILVDDAAAVSENMNSCDDNIRKVRTYDLSITYDKYYQTPKIWLFGYSPDGSLLTADEMFEDIISDYVRRTVTIENHPFVDGPHLSIHPCQHAAVMKNIVDNMTSSASDNKPSVEMYLFIFLKFVSSIIPTIHYDFTMEVEADVKKKKK